MKIHVFGSDFKGDDIAFKLAKDLDNVLEHEFIVGADPTELIYEDELYIMDAIQKIKEVTLFVNIDALEVNRINSLHDFDLGYFLKLADKMGMKKKLTIIGLPMQGDYNRIKADVTDSLQELKDFSCRL